MITMSDELLFRRQWRDLLSDFAGEIARETRCNVHVAQQVAQAMPDILWNQASRGDIKSIVFKLEGSVEFLGESTVQVEATYWDGTTQRLGFKGGLQTHRIEEPAAVKGVRPPNLRAAQISTLAAKLLPDGASGRYDAEFYAELYELSAQNAGRWAQLRYSLNQLARAMATRAELRRTLGTWKVSIGLGVGGGGGTFAILGGWSTVADIAILSCAALGGAVYVVSSSERTERVIALIRTIRSAKKSK